jgi:hypothetical protein
MYVIEVFCWLIISTCAGGVCRSALWTHRPQSRLGERGGTPSTGLGWNDLDGLGGIMGRGRGKQPRIRICIRRGAGEIYLSAESRIRKVTLCVTERIRMSRSVRACAKNARSLRRDFFVLARLLIPSAKVLRVRSPAWRVSALAAARQRREARKSLAAPAKRVLNPFNSCYTCLKDTVLDARINPSVGEPVGGA